MADIDSLNLCDHIETYCFLLQDKYKQLVSILF